ncbi:MAG TPA: recombinase family protein [Saprospiraceae bacterium]|nr:recombinase family protein [Saprospiraceae bacterium]
MTGKKIAYIRVSTLDQNPERQLDGLEVDKKFIDYASGKDTNRPQLQQMLDYIREDDIIFVHSMDRMARNVKDLIHTIDLITSKKSTVFFVNENLKFSGDDSPISRLILTVLGAIAEFQLAINKEAQREGIVLAKKAGKYKGRKRSLNEEKILLLKELIKTRNPKTQIAKQLGIARLTLYKYLNEMKEEEKAS